ncbi:50S ribosomal protein L7/L12 [Enterobacteriaceae endosymbiont of Donacia bicoloricornis]|uniref:50S ribosomal protein L7/L12 n=1 Tax=Enterobacteriaceae endosymbiont of Donacia bicoloricornis TaxID=2675772 RepID=UPI001449A158|nr:50S ribosomal protein L7/L12 [Enterobacteriaceae endosymbiont of Donacia bicoloricornis]QJC37831.1 50S ribosomal protein L7/L12 [Enterobacteriaceae endosymbiont of Donacia bicoloricornis]
MSITKEQIIEAIESMSIMDIMELIKSIEKKFGVSSIRTNEKINSQKKEEKKEKTEFNIYLKNIGKNKISVIKTVRSIMNLGLKEAKDLVESAPVVLKESINKEEALDLETKLKNAGAEIEIK